MHKIILFVGGGGTQTSCLIFFLQSVSTDFALRSMVQPVQPSSQARDIYKGTIFIFGIKQKSNEIKYIFKIQIVINHNQKRKGKKLTKTQSEIETKFTSQIKSYFDR